MVSSLVCRWRAPCDSDTSPARSARGHSDIAAREEWLPLRAFPLAVHHGHEALPAARHVHSLSDVHGTAGSPASLIPDEHCFPAK